MRRLKPTVGCNASERRRRRRRKRRRRYGLTGLCRICTACTFVLGAVYKTHITNILINFGFELNKKG